MIFGTGLCYNADLQQPECDKIPIDWSCVCKAKAGVIQMETVWAKAKLCGPTLQRGRLRHGTRCT